MTIRWTQPANDAFLGIVEGVAARNSTAAAPVDRRILAAVEQPAEFPLRGKLGRSPDKRELVISGLPYVVFAALKRTISALVRKGKL